MHKIFSIFLPNTKSEELYINTSSRRTNYWPLKPIDLISFHLTLLSALEHQRKLLFFQKKSIRFDESIIKNSVDPK